MDRKYDNNTWVYYNGELYHAGVKGMHWYQHLPGTDWWKNVGKAAKTSYKESMDRNSPYVRDSKSGQMVQKKSYLGAIKSAGAAAKAVGKMVLGRAHGYLANESRYYGNKLKTGVRNAYGSAKTGTSKLWNSAKGHSQEQINKYRESARQAYKDVRKQIYNVMGSYYSSSNNRYMEKGIISDKGDSVNYLKDFVDGAPGKALKAYENAKLDGPFATALNSFIQTTKFNVGTACARYLDSISMDDEVASFLNKLHIKPKK